MASDDIILRFTYSTTEQDTDIRTFRVHQITGNADGTTTELELYKVTRSCHCVSLVLSNAHYFDSFIIQSSVPMLVSQRWDTRPSIV